MNLLMNSGWARRAVVALAALAFAVVPAASTMADDQWRNTNCGRKPVYETTTCYRNLYEYDCRYVETDTQCGTVCRNWYVGIESYSCQRNTGKTKRVCDRVPKQHSHNEDLAEQARQNAASLGINIDGPDQHFAKCQSSFGEYNGCS